MLEQDPTTRHDPRPPTEDPDPTAERRRKSARFYAGVQAAIDARPKQPTHIVTAHPTDLGHTITVDDGYGTAITIEKADKIGRTVLEVTSLGDTVRVELSGFAAQILDGALRQVADLGVTAPIVGHR